MVAKIRRPLRARLQKRSQAKVRLIVRVKGDVAGATARLAELDVTVLRSFFLLNAVAIQCSGDQALRLLREPWVTSVEEDRQVSVQ
jgi:hypothetical protein